MDRTEAGVDGEPDLPTERDLQRLCADLLASWQETYRDLGTVELGHPEQYLDGSRFLRVFALASHSHHLLSAACALMSGGQYLPAVPIVRSAYESAVTAAWAAITEEAGRALHNEAARSARVLIQDASQAHSFREYVEGLQPPEPVDADNSAQAAAKTFKNMCSALAPNGEDLYIVYRLLSALCHPSIEVVTSFVREGWIEIDPVTEVEAVHWWHAASLGLLLSGQALNMIDRAAPRTYILNAAARELGRPSRLELTSLARKRAESALARRRSGPEGTGGT